jgi:polyferredoxin
VCPTGIDIREGPQIGCITCALCVDACDSVMTQIGRPCGLIDYVTFEDAEKEKAGLAATPVLKTLFRPRTIAYLMIWGSVGLALLFALGNRTRLDISAQHDRNPLYVRMSDGSVRNAYTVKLRNMESRPRTVRVMMAGVPQALMWLGNAGRASAARSFEAKLTPDAVTKLRLFVISPGGDGSRQDFTLSVQGLDDPRPSDSHALVLERGGE